MALPLTSLAPAATAALRCSMVPAAACAEATNFSKVLRACSKLASAIDRISLGISKRSRASSLMLCSLRWRDCVRIVARGPLRDRSAGEVPHLEPLAADYNQPTRLEAKGYQPGESTRQGKVIHG